MYDNYDWLQKNIRKKTNNYFLPFLMVSDVSAVVIFFNLQFFKNTHFSKFQLETIQKNNDKKQTITSHKKSILLTISIVELLL